LQHSFFSYPEAPHNGGNAPQDHEEFGEKWTKYIGDAWTLPPDHRIDLGFQKKSLEKLSPYDLKFRLEELQSFNDNLLDSQTPLHPRRQKRRNWFRHLTIEDTSPHPPFEARTYTIGQAISRSFSQSAQDEISDFPDTYKTSANKAQAESQNSLVAPWQRLM